MLFTLILALANMHDDERCDFIEEFNLEYISIIDKNQKINELISDTKNIAFNFFKIKILNNSMEMEISYLLEAIDIKNKGQDYLYDIEH